MATINPRTLFQTFLNAPRPTATVAGANRPGLPAAIGRGIWQINAKATFNGNANSVPVVLHNVISNTTSALIYPGYFDTVLWFDYATTAVIGACTYGSNWNNQTGANNSPWILENTKATGLPNSSLTVNYLTSPTIPVWTSTPVNATFKAPLPFALTGQQDPYRVGAAATLPTGRTVRITSNINTVSINNVLRLRYNIESRNGSTVLSSDNFDFYFNVTTGFIYADFPEEIVRNNNGILGKVATTVRWTPTSGF
jgi:hypothetical protein